jgi:hypothetical protein
MSEPALTPKGGDAPRTPPVPPVPVGDDMETVKRFFLIAAVSIMTGLMFLAVCAFLVARNGG